MQFIAPSSPTLRLAVTLIALGITLVFSSKRSKGRATVPTPKHLGVKKTF